MKIVIQCAAKKDPAAGFLKTREGTPVLFVAQPDAAPITANQMYARPDDNSDRHGKTWRGFLANYNTSPAKNPLGLFQAYELYENKTYRTLVSTYGAENVFILSAGWGLVSARYLLPQYDITFSASAPSYKRRRPRDVYHDFMEIPNEKKDDIVFFGGKDYRPLFCSLTADVEARKIVFYNSNTLPSMPGCELVRYHTTARTNWHYECANALISGKFRI